MSGVVKTPLSAIKNQPGGIGGLDSSARAQFSSRDAVSVLDFDSAGTVGVGNAAADTAALSAAIDYVNARTGIVAPLLGSAIAYSPKIVIPNGLRLLVNETLPAPRFIEADGFAIIEAENSTDTIFELAGSYQFRASNLAFIGGKHHVSLSNSNTNFGLWHFENCTFSNSSDYAVVAANTSGSYPVTSTMLVMDNCRWNSCKKILSTQCDHAWVNGGWMQLSADNFDADSAAIYCGGMLNVNRVMMVPFAAGDTQPARSRWIDNRGAVRFHQVRVGGEGGGIPLVYHFARPTRFVAGDARSIEAGITLDQCTLYGGPGSRGDSSIINLRGEIPASVRINSCTGPIDRPFILNEGAANGGIDLSTYLPALSAEWSGDDLQAELIYSFVGNKVRGTQALIPSELLPYATFS